ncbi:MAG: hypothetical protein HQK65_04565 [Desulfamplus sp.]|nr:hypothetical protein [Desulfamplus sp.]
MEVIVPQFIVSDEFATPHDYGVLLSSSITADATARWVAGTTYAENDLVTLCEPADSSEPGIIKKYKSLQSANTGNNPYSSPTHWVSLGATERYKMFDLFTDSATTVDGDINVKLYCKRINAIAFLNVQASGITINAYIGNELTDIGIEYSGAGTDLTFTDMTSIVRASGSFTTDGFKAGDLITVSGSTSNDGTYRILLIRDSGTRMLVLPNSLTPESGISGTAITIAPIKSTTIALEDQLYSWEDYFFGDFQYTSDVSQDIVIQGVNDMVIDITFHQYDSGIDCFVGHCIPGRKYDIGETLWSPTTSIETFGRIIEDPHFGYTYLKQGNFKKLLEVDLKIPTDRANIVNNVLTQLREIPTLYQANQNDTSYNGLLVYGYYDDMKITYETHNYIEGRLSIRGMV